MKKIILIIILISSLPSFAQMVPQWKSQMGLPTYSGGNPRGMVLDDSNNVYLLDNVVNFGNLETDCQDPVLHKLNKNGQTLWTKNFGTIPCAQELSQCLKIDNDKNLFVLCQIADTRNEVNSYVIKLNNNGDILWKTNIGKALNFFDSKMELSSLGFVYVSIKNFNFNFSYENRIFKISPEGLKTDSIKISSDNGPGFIYDFKILSDNEIYILFYDETLNSFISLVDSKGSVKWINNTTYYSCSLLDKDSSLVISNPWIINKFNKHGNIVWSKAIYGSNPNSFNGNSIRPHLILTKDNNIIFAGCAPVTNQSHTFLITKFNSQTGDSVWGFKLINTIPDNSMLTDIAMDSSGKYYACGLIFQANTLTGNSYGIIKLSSEGNLLRTTLNEGYLNKFLMPSYIAACTDNSIVMEGFYDGQASYEQSLTIKYSQPVNIISNSNTLTYNFSLAQNYPNPFNPTTVIGFQLPADGFVNLKIYDINGREVSELVNAKLNAGEYKIDFNAGNLPSGVYYYKMTTESFSETKKMILVK